MEYVTSLGNTPQNEGIEIVCSVCMKISAKTTHYRREMLRLILKENSLQLGGKPYLQTHGTATGTKTTGSFANIFMAYIETQINSKLNRL